MKIPPLLLTILLLSIGLLKGFSQSIKRCGNMEYEVYLRSVNPLYDQERADAEKKLKNAIQKIKEAKTISNQSAFSQYTMPVVVHVVYSQPSENVPDSLIIRTIDQVNSDWSRTNADAAKTPSPWQSVAANMEIQFCLASTNPNGYPTNGIIHKQTSVASFPVNDDVKSATSGGDDPWDVTKYLNIWFCNLSGGILGYSTFPPVGSDYGTVVHYCSVAGGTCTPYIMGRTLTHELGHVFDLFHVWGDDGGACIGSDSVPDTPNQSDATYGCPAFPYMDGCSGDTTSGNMGDPVNGIMFMNYMDYTDDACYNMFTTEQKTRAQAALTSFLSSLADHSTIACGLPDCEKAGAMYFPNAFSPNGDGDNDCLKNYYANTDCIKVFHLEVYDRFGENVFDTTDPLFKWDGTYMQKELNPQILSYYLRLQFNDGKILEKKGNISLIR